MRVNRLITVAFAAAVAVLVSLTSEARLLQIEDYLNWEWVADPQISLDGETIVYTRRHVNKLQDRFDSELWIMDADGKRNRRLMEQAGSEVTWSPDGTRIAYIAKTDDGSDIFVRWMDATGNVTRVTRGVNQPSSLSWSPDGSTIAYRALVPCPNIWDINLPAKPTGANWSKDSFVVDTLHYRLDGLGMKPCGFRHIFTVSADSGTSRQLTGGEWHAGALLFGQDLNLVPLNWSNDGRSIIFSADRAPDADLAVARSSLYAVNVETRDLHRITTSPGYAVGPQVSPNGKWIAYIGVVKVTESNFANRELRIINLNSSNDRALISDIPDYQPKIQWAKDSKGLYVVHDKEGAHNLRYVSLNGKVKDITSGQQSLSIDSVSDSGIAVGTRTTVDRPMDVVRFDIASGRNMQWLTTVNEDILDGVKLGRVEEIWYNSTDDTRIQGWVIYPPDFKPNKKYPLLLRIHGGPVAMYTGNFSAASWDFTFQDYAAQGYVVLYTNPRGSSGYGGDFARAIYNEYPGRRDFEDLMHGVDTVVAKGFIDEERMYVEGCSGGGILTAWVVTQTDRFAGAATMCTSVNAISKAGTSDIPAYNFNNFKDYFWEDPAAWLEHSAIMHVNKVKTPTLVMVGEHDIRTPVGQSQEFYTALKILGVPTKLIVIQDEGHGTWAKRPSNMLRTRLYLRKWYSEWRRIERKDGPFWQQITP